MRTTNRIISLGNFIDFLEFSIFSSLLPLIANDLVHGQTQHDKVSLAYLLFCIGFLGRPLGAFILGYLGDRLGRRYALIFSLAGMSATTFCLAILPSFLYAHYFIAFIRFVQGIFTGGEYANAAVYLIENNKSTSRYQQIGSLTTAGIMGAAVGQLIGIIVSMDYVPYLTWRTVFLLVSTFSVYVAAIQLCSIEKDNFERIPLRLKDFLSFLASRYVVIGIVFGGVMNGLFYFFYTFVGTYSSLIKSSFQLNSYMVSFAASLVICGLMWLCSRMPVLEKYTPSFFLKLSLIVMIVLIYPLFLNITSGNLSILTILIFIIFIFFMQIFTLVTLKNLPEFFPRNCRVLLYGFPEGIGAAFLGGASPYISTQLIHFTGNENSPILYFLSLMVISLLLICFWPLRKPTKEADFVPFITS